MAFTSRRGLLMSMRIPVILCAALALACGGTTSPTTPSTPSAPAAALPSELGDIAESEIQAAAGMPGLTDEEREAIRAAFAAARQALADVRARLAAGEITLPEALAAARLIHAELFATVQSILPDRPDTPQNLGLTREQVAQILAIRLETLAFLRDLHGQVARGELTGEAARAAFQAHLQEQSRRICAVMTPEQQVQSASCAA